MKEKPRARPTARQAIDAWIVSQRLIFEREVCNGSGALWDKPFWRMDHLRKQKNVNDTKLDINFGSLTAFLRTPPIDDRRLDRRKQSFHDFARALVIDKAVRRNWVVSKVTLNDLVLTIGFLCRASVLVPAMHPAELTGRHFDEAQRLLVEAIYRRDEYIEKRNLPENTKVHRIDEFGDLYITEGRAYTCTVVMREIAKTLHHLKGGSSISFTSLVFWDERKLNSRGLERSRTRDALFPDLGAIYFFADLANKKDLPDKDRLYIRLMELVLIADKRISEVLALPVDPVVEKDGILGLRYAPRKGAPPYITWIPQESSSVHPIKRLSVETESTWDAARKMFTRAIKEIQEITAGPRAIAAELEAACESGVLSLPPPENRWPFFISDYEVSGLIPGTDLSEYYTKDELAYFGLGVYCVQDELNVMRVEFTKKISYSDSPYIARSDYLCLSPADRDEAWQRFVTERARNRPEEYLSLEDFARAFHGSLKERARIRRWWFVYHRLLHGNDFSLTPKEIGAIANAFVGPRIMMHKSDFIKFVLKKYRKNRIVSRGGSKSGELLLRDSLFCIGDGLARPRQSHYELFVRPLLAVSFRKWLLGGLRQQSVFSRYGRDDLKKFSAHMLRRFNTTELRLAGVSSIYIARQAGRSVRHVNDYDYIKDSELMEIGKKHFYENSIFESKYISELTKDLEGHAISLRTITEFVKGQLSGRSATEFGSCSHEHSIGACPSFKACYMGCNEFWVKKGDIREVVRHREDYQRTWRALQIARSQLGEAFYSAHYVIQYGAQLITLRSMLAIHADCSIPDGAMIKPMPQKRVPSADSLRALFDDEESLREILEAVDRLIAAGDVNGGEAA